MKIRNLVILSIIMLFTLGSCGKNDDYDPAAQAAIDDALIAKFIADKNITAIKHASGVYYQIISSGSGSTTYSSSTKVTAKYAGRLLDGTVFDQTTTTPLTFPLGNVIVGWQIGVPLIKKGGKIRLLIPSGYGFGRDGSGKIPSNAVLDFDIELVDVQ